MELDLSTGTPSSPERTLQLAEAMAEIVRTLNHQTRHHEALRYPSDADRLLREIETAAMRLPQLLDQIGSWVVTEVDAARIEITDGEWEGNLGGAVTALRIRLDTARGDAEALSADLKRAASVTSTMGAVEG